MKILSIMSVDIWSYISPKQSKRMHLKKNWDLIFIFKEFKKSYFNY